ncbi:MAG: ABC transporter ATP-binding protein [Planctomycetaceae bacterium]
MQTTDPPSNWSLIRRMLALGWVYRFHSIRVVVLQMVLVGISLVGLGLTGLGIDWLRTQVDKTAIPPQWPFGWKLPSSWTTGQSLWFIAGLILCTAIVNAALKFLAAVDVAILTQRILVQLRSTVYDKLQRLSFRFFDHNDSSSIINRAAGDVNSVRAFVDGVIVKVLTVGLTLVVYVAYMLSVHVPLTIVCLVTTPLLWWGAARFSRAVQPEYVKGSKLMDRLILTLAENVQGAQVVKGFAREPEQIAEFAAANQAIRDQKQKIFRTISVFQPIMGGLTQVNMMILLGYGGYLVIHGELALGQGLFVFANLLHEFANQVGQITNIANTIQSSLTGAQRVFEVMDAPIEILSAANASRLPRAAGKVEFDRVSFAYDPEKPVLKDISCTVEPGQCVAIVGETGAGKSTLLSLILRCYDPQSGTIRVDGHDVRQLHLDDLRRNIGIVFQDQFLFSHTVASNIAFGHPEATDEQIAWAARIAAADEFIRELPDGYETVIGEQGCNLSGGQRQRLAIARALLLDPPILILDDATAAIDPETEHEIQQAVEQALQGRTTFLVGNRLSTVRRADKIFVLEEGRVVQSGTHDELLAVEGHYRRLARLQYDELSAAETEPPEVVSVVSAAGEER